MKLVLEKKRKNNQVKRLAEQMAEMLITDPVFMLYCPEKSKRLKFIKAYFKYYIPIWIQQEKVLVDESRSVMLVMLDKSDLQASFFSKKPLSMRLGRNSQNIFMHREIINGISEIILPETMDCLCISVFGKPQTSLNSIAQLTAEAKEYAAQKNCALIYETFSKKLIPAMEGCGFSIAYQKQFLNTQFLQTVMVFAN